ncbi:hypothetical protein Misp03_10600 [Microbispora sp. NBRC 16548]|nr:hypothetical protein Misp03_10600 [Microbispora sp. NBRC 16548]
MHPLLADHFEHARLGQQPDMPVHGGPRHIGQVCAQVTDRTSATAARREGRRRGPTLAENDGKTRLYNEFAASVPRGENRIVEDAGHVTLPFRRPEAVVQAIRDVLAW